MQYIYDIAETFCNQKNIKLKYNSLVGAVCDRVLDVYYIYIVRWSSNVGRRMADIVITLCDHSNWKAIWRLTRTL